MIFLFSACAESEKKNSSDKTDETSSKNSQPTPLLIADVVDILNETGATVIYGPVDTAKMFGKRSYILDVNSYQIVTYEFDSNDEFEQTFILDSSGTVSNTTLPATADWVGRPHFYRRENVLILYVGCEGLFLNLLENSFGEPFAGEECYFREEQSKNENALIQEMNKNRETDQAVNSLFDIAKIFEDKGSQVELESRYFDVTLNSHARLLLLDEHPLRIFEYESSEALEQLFVSPCGQYLGAKDEIKWVTWGKWGDGLPYFYLYGNLLIIHAEHYMSFTESFSLFLEKTLGSPFAGPSNSVPSCIYQAGESGVPLQHNSS